MVVTRNIGMSDRIDTPLESLRPGPSHTIGIRSTWRLLARMALILEACVYRGSLLITPGGTCSFCPGDLALPYFAGRIEGVCFPYVYCTCI